MQKRWCFALSYCLLTKFPKIINQVREYAPIFINIADVGIQWPRAWKCLHDFCQHWHPLFTVNLSNFQDFLQLGVPLYEINEQ